MALLASHPPLPLPALPPRQRPAVNGSTPFLPHLSSAKSLTSSSKPGYRRPSVRLVREGSTAAPELLEAAARDPELKIKAEGPDEGEGHSSKGDDPEEGAPAGGERRDVADLLRQLNLKFASEDDYSILIYGTGALLSLWMSVAIVSALDSIPLIPEVMEVVGFGFTVWFSFRYLIFKKSRDELFLKLDGIKKHILGQSDN